MTGSTSGRRGGLLASATTAVLLATGCAASDDGAAPAAGSTPPTASSTASPSSTSAPSVAASAPSATGRPTAAATDSPADGPADGPAVLGASEPVSLSVPATGTESELLRLGLREDGSLEVPPEGPGSPASWYTGSPTPGERGPAVLLGHVNATGGGPGVFAGLRALEPGDTIEVAREDGSTAVFAVDRGEQYGKDDFPTLEVYGNTEGSELRLITCDGFDPATGEFDDNYVVYASLVP
ncbi:MULTISPECIES: class F sortase [Kocuria]|uniref:class F sortase n=1 Tax=Kocuria TaxID=57493 RepID=UPI000D65BBF4|nr:class F sortase [Kocuria rosea]PWF84453.1 class F sortase [Kocuria rosea]THE15735.1 class F sortase [Kocuria rosea]